MALEKRHSGNNDCTIFLIHKITNNRNMQISISKDTFSHLLVSFDQRIYEIRIRIVRSFVWKQMRKKYKFRYFLELQHREERTRKTRKRCSNGLEYPLALCNIQQRKTRSRVCTNRWSGRELLLSAEINWISGGVKSKTKQTTPTTRNRGVG